MSRLRDVDGLVFGKWTVLRRSSRVDSRGTRSWALAVCVCGLVKEVGLNHLASGQSLSCRSCSIARHGATSNGRRTPEYVVWNSMKKRCLNPKSSSFHNYGGRGIRIHQEWADSFAAFLSYVGRRPSIDHQLDRIDNDGNYEPGNVRWATRAENSQNRRPRYLRSSGHDALGLR